MRKPQTNSGDSPSLLRRDRIAGDRAASTAATAPTISAAAGAATAARTAAATGATAATTSTLAAAGTAPYVTTASRAAASATRGPRTRCDRVRRRIHAVGVGFTEGIDRSEHHQGDHRRKQRILSCILSRFLPPESFEELPHHSAFDSEGTRMECPLAIDCYSPFPPKLQSGFLPDPGRPLISPVISTADLIRACHSCDVSWPGGPAWRGYAPSFDSGFSSRGAWGASLRREVAPSSAKQAPGSSRTRLQSGSVSSLSPFASARRDATMALK